MSEIKCWTVAVGNLPTPFTPQKQRKAGIAACRFIAKLDGFVGFYPDPPRGTLCLFRSENDAKRGKNRMEAKEIATGRNIGTVFVDEKYTNNSPKATDAVIWRKSVYDTRRCPQCGATLISKDNQPVNTIENKLPFVGKKYLLCENCNLPVAFIEPYNGPMKPGDMGGHWDGDK